MTETTPPNSPLIARRALLTALGLAPLATLAACDSVKLPAAGYSQTPAPKVTAAPGPILRGTLNSAATGDSREWIICYPPGSKPGAKLPVAIALHGLGDALSILEAMQYPGHLAEAVGAGVPPFAIAAIFGSRMFWQKSGSQDGGALVATEFVAELAKQGLNTSRLALTGWSMGGWGAFRLASNELRGKLRAVAALSTPCYANFDEIPEPRWLNRADFDANNFYAHTAELTNLPIYLACGSSDPFVTGNLAFAKSLAATAGVAAPITDFGPGDHSPAYWESKAAAQFRFLGEHL